MFPVVGFPIQMHHGQDPDLSGLDGVEDSIREAVDQTPMDFTLDHGPRLGYETMFRMAV